MSTDKSLTEAVAAMESAWRRLREVLDGPDVAAALVERQAVAPRKGADLPTTWPCRMPTPSLVERHAGPRPMSTAPRDGNLIVLHQKDGKTVKARCDRGFWWIEDLEGLRYTENWFIGWSPVK